MKSRVVLSVIAILILGTLLIPSCTKARSEEDLYGTWQGEYHDFDLLFVFNADGTCSLNFTDKVSGKTDELTGTFETDFSKYPAQLDINNIPQLSHGLYTIFKFTENGSLSIAEFAPRWRLCPISFQADATMNLKQM